MGGCKSKTSAEKASRATGSAQSPNENTCPQQETLSTVENHSKVEDILMHKSSSKLQDQQRRRLSVSVTQLDNDNTEKSDAIDTQNSADLDALTPGMTEEYSNGHRGTVMMPMASIRREKSLPLTPKDQDSLKHQSSMRSHPSENAGSAELLPESSFARSLPKLFKPLPFDIKDAWKKPDSITAELLLNTFTPPDHKYRCAIIGAPSTERQRGFDNKKMDLILSQKDITFDNFQDSIGVGCSCKKGLKPESPNQDDFSMLRCNDFGLYAVFDGHGPYGHDVSDYVHRQLILNFLADPDLKKDYHASLKNAFLKTHRSLIDYADSNYCKGLDCTLSGCTGTLVVQHDSKLSIAFVGDSRVVVARRKKDGGIEVAYASKDHKPTNSMEKSRIEASGGEVLRLECDIPYRVFVRGRLYPGLAMSRALGDTIAQDVGVSCEPEIVEVPIDDDTLFFIVASDGVWEFISSEEAVEFVAKNIKGSAQPHSMMREAADRLAYESFRRWIEEEGNVVDDVTLMVVWLQRRKDA